MVICPICWCTYEHIGSLLSYLCAVLGPTAYGIYHMLYVHLGGPKSHKMGHILTFSVRSEKYEEFIILGFPGSEILTYFSEVHL